jgi:hypothetical protein
VGTEEVGEDVDVDAKVDGLDEDRGVETAIVLQPELRQDGEDS